MKSVKNRVLPLSCKMNVFPRYKIMVAFIGKELIQVWVLRYILQIILFYMLLDRVKEDQFKSLNLKEF